MGSEAANFHREVNSLSQDFQNLAEVSQNKGVLLYSAEQKQFYVVILPGAKGTSFPQVASQTRDFKEGLENLKNRLTNITDQISTLKLNGSEKYLAEVALTNLSRKIVAVANKPGSPLSEIERQRFAEKEGVCDITKQIRNYELNMRYQLQELRNSQPHVQETPPKQPSPALTRSAPPVRPSSPERASKRVSLGSQRTASNPTPNAQTPSIPDVDRSKIYGKPLNAQTETPQPRLRPETPPRRMAEAKPHTLGSSSQHVQDPKTETPWKSSRPQTPPRQPRAAQARISGSAPQQTPPIPDVDRSKIYGQPLNAQRETPRTPSQSTEAQTHTLGSGPQRTSNNPSVDRSKIYGKPIHASSNQAVKLSKMNEEQVNQWFSNLATKTAQRFEDKKIMYSEAYERFDNIHSPHHTAYTTKVNNRVEYLHANYVQGQDSSRLMLVTQAPTHGTEHLFWKAAIQQGGKIVDLTSNHDDLSTKYNKEGKPINPIPYRNYPTQIGVPVDFGTGTVTLQSSKPLPNGLQGSSNTYIVKDRASGKEYPVVREHYTGWPDFGVVSPQELDNLVNTLAPGNAGPVVHCRAGVGRSGTFVMAAFIKDAVASGKMTEANVEEKLEEMILEAREQRGEHFVQAQGQLGLLKDYALMLLDRQTNRR